MRAPAAVGRRAASAAVGRRLAAVGRIPVYPTLIAASLVLSLHGDAVAPVSSLVRPLAVAVLAVGAMQLAVAALVRDAGRGALVTSVVVAGIVDWRLATALVGAAAALRLVPVVRAAVAGRVRVADVTRGANAVALVLVVITGTSVVAAHPPEAGPRREPGGPAVPNVYVLLLDGYPRADTLATLGHDQAPLLAELADLGFRESARSRANYPATLMTLASMFEMRHLAEIAPQPPARPADQARLLSRSIRQGRGLDALRGAGFEIVALPSPFSEVAVETADRYLDHGGITAFELELLQFGSLSRLLPDIQRTVIADDLRARFEWTFDRLAQVATEPAPRPRFTFAHVMSPHQPTLFGPDGEPTPLWPCYPVDCTIWDSGVRHGVEQVNAGLVGQVRYVNRRLIETMTAVVRADPDAVVVVLSDHGHRTDLQDRDEMLRSFLVARTPGHPGLFPDDVTPINLIPRLLNAYAGGTLPMASEASYWLDTLATPERGYFVFEPWDPSPA